MEDDADTWQRMSPFRLLVTLSCVAGAMSSLVFIAGSSANLFGCLLMPLFITWLCFAVIWSVGGMLSIVVYFVFEMLMVFVSNDDTKTRLWIGIRWTILIVGVITIVWVGGRGFVDGMVNNRLANPETLYDQCTQPETRTVKHSWQECSDGWGSSSIGRRGACSHHGGVVWRTIQRHEQYQPHDEAFCKKDAAARSWID